MKWYHVIIGALVALVIYLWFRPSPWKAKYNEVTEAYNKKLSDYNRLVDSCNARIDTCVTRTNVVIKKNNVKVKVNNDKIKTIRDTLMMRCDTIWADSVRFENLEYLEVVPDMPDFDKVFDPIKVVAKEYNNAIGLSVSYTDRWHYGVAYERRMGRLSIGASAHYPALFSVNLKFSFR